MLVLDLTLTGYVLMIMWIASSFAFGLAASIMKGQGKQVNKPIAIAMLSIIALLFVGMCVIRVYGVIEIAPSTPYTENCKVIQVDPVKGDVIKCYFEVKVHFKEP